MIMTIAIFGAGAWGTALAVHCARQGHRVTLVPRRYEHAMELASVRENRDYLPGFPLDDSIQIGCEPGPVLMEAEVALLACPSNGLRELCRSLAAVRAKARALELVLTLCKGLEQDTLLKPAEVVREELPDLAAGVLSGPTNAAGVAAGQPTAVVLAGGGDEVSRRAQHALSGPTLRVYRSDDIAGVELGGCLKNIYAIGAGVCDGLKLGDNTKAAFLTRALHEMVKLGAKLGGQPETFYGLSGFGDLVATCFGSWSRNRAFGEALADGTPVASLLEGRKTVVEGYAATGAFHQALAGRTDEAPLLGQIHGMLYEGKEPRSAITELMTRELKHEN